MNEITGISEQQNKSKNIYQRINAVRDEVQYIRKDAVVQGYAAVTHDMVTAKLRDSLIKHGIIIIPSAVSREALIGETANKKPKIMFRAVYDVAFINVDFPEDRFVMQTDAHADDSGDKAPGKALSYATKYAMLKVFSLETGESDESRVEDERRGYTEAQKQAFDNIFEMKDALGMRLFQDQVEDEVSTGLFNSFPKGEKTKKKELCRNLVFDGGKLFQDLNNGLAKSDDVLAYESTSAMSNTGESLLRRYLGRESYANLQEIRKKFEGANSN